MNLLITKTCIPYIDALEHPITILIFSIDSQLYALTNNKLLDDLWYISLGHKVKLFTTNKAGPILFDNLTPEEGAEVWAFFKKLDFDNYKSDHLEDIYNNHKSSARLG
jgi:hypothetical protein